MKQTFNFHIHTNYSSDGFNTFAQLYRHAVKNKIDVLAITDHDTIEGAVHFSDWLKNKQKNKIQLIIGEEVTCSDGTHIIGLFLKKAVTATAPLDVVKEIKAQGALVYFPHPSRKDGILNSASCEAALPYGDFYEYFNAKINNDYNEAAVAKLSAYTHLKPLGGSDAHYNYDVRKCLCTLETDDDLFNSLVTYKQHGRIKIEGVKKWGSNNYLPGYYKVKDKLQLPGFIKNIGKNIFPLYKNYKDSKQKLVLETILDTTGSSVSHPLKGDSPKNLAAIHNNN
ncbi:MAG: PHP domain-containing protein [Bacteroidetes bacterium]|nr:PHP domain-containing protein [Bacteroidota bacterium]